MNELHFRHANEADCALVYKWFQDQGTRENSFSKDEVLYDEHSVWYQNRINQKESPYLIFWIHEEADMIIGQVRLDQRPEGPVIGITVAPEHRGKGYASLMLRAAVNYFYEQYKINTPIRAWIMNKNIASQRAFTDAGFKFNHSADVAGIPSSLYLYQPS